jgi:hypothetical protein
MMKTLLKALGDNAMNMRKLLARQRRKKLKRLRLKGQIALFQAGMICIAVALP